MYIKCSALYVGQGAANLIEVYENEGDAAAHALILIDFGSAGKKGGSGAVNEPAGFAARDYLARVLGAKQGKLDLLILSHLDEDHINEIAPLKDAGILKEIGTAIIGGTNSGITSKMHPFQKNSRMKKNVNRVVKTLAQAVVGICNDIRIFTADDGYLDSDSNVYEVRLGGAELVLKLLANRSTPGIKGASEFINSNSSVTVAQYRDGSSHFALIFPGDATSDTFRFINNRFRDAQKKQKYTFLEASERILIMPHHAALKTACNSETIRAKDKLNNQLSETQYFADTIKPTAVYASAHYNAKRYFHPSLSSMGLFVAHMADSAAAHHVFGFELRVDAQGFPECPGKSFSPRYDLRTQTCTRQAYTAHTIEENIDKEAVSYAGGRNRIGLFEDKTHLFGNLVCEIKGGVMTCNYEKL